MSDHHFEGHFPEEAAQNEIGGPVLVSIMVLGFIVLWADQAFRDLILFQVPCPSEVFISSYEHEPILVEFQVALFKTEHVSVARFCAVRIGVVCETVSSGQ